MKLRKLFRKSRSWLLAVTLLVFYLCATVDDFVKLHNGTPVEAVESYKYSPVLSETFILVLIAFFILIGLRFLAKWSALQVGLTGIALCGLVGYFAYWAFGYTRQSPLEGFASLGWMILSVALFIGLLLLYEKYIYHARKRTRGRHSLAKLHNALEGIKTYDCICGRGGDITLGLAWAKAVNILFGLPVLLFIPLAFYYDDATLESSSVILTLALIGVFMWNYFEIYRDMRRNLHSAECSKTCARTGAWYQGKGSSFAIYTPRQTKKSPGAAVDSTHKSSR